MNCKMFNAERTVPHIYENIANLLAMQLPLKEVQDRVKLYKQELETTRYANTKFSSVCYFIWSCTEKIMTWNIDNSLETLIIYDFLVSIGDAKNADLVFDKIVKIVEPVLKKEFELLDTYSKDQVYLMMFGLFRPATNNLYTTFITNKKHDILRELLM